MSLPCVLHKCMIPYFLSFTRGLVANSVGQWIRLKLRQPEFQSLNFTKNRFVAFYNIHDATLKHLPTFFYLSALDIDLVSSSDEEYKLPPHSREEPPR